MGPAMMINELFDAIERGLATEGCDGTLRFARTWAEDTGRDPLAFEGWLQARGGFCDCEVLLNIPRPG